MDDLFGEVVVVSEGYPRQACDQASCPNDCSLDACTFDNWCGSDCPDCACDNYETVD